VFGKQQIENAPAREARGVTHAQIDPTEHRAIRLRPDSIHPRGPSGGERVVADTALAG
jgi:hypothetical protein